MQDRQKENLRNITQRNMAPQTKKAFRKLCIIQAALAISVFALAAALKVVVILYHLEKNDHLERAKVSNEALKLQNQILHQRISERNVVHDGYHYYFSCCKMSWHEAEKYCMLQDSHLTSVTSVEEQEFLYTKARGIHYWIGLSNQTVVGWQWTDGTPYDEAQSKEFWAQDKPSHKKYQNCAYFWAFEQKSWNNFLCSHHFKFICKKKYKSQEMFQNSC